jgi:hypothetical protein
MSESDDEWWNKMRAKIIQELVSDLLHRNIDKEPENLTDQEWTEAWKAYLREYSEINNPTPHDSDSLHLRGFCRAYPLNNQDTMVVATEPALKSGENKPITADNYELAELTARQDREQESMEGSYLNRYRSKPGPATKLHKVICKTAQRVIDSSDSPLPNMEFSYVDHNSKHAPEDIHSEVYYTNYYKFATQDDDGNKRMKKYNDIFCDWLVTETEKVDPDVIFLCGGPCWNQLRSYLEPVGHTQETDWANRSGHQGLNIKDVIGYPFRMAVTDTPDTLAVPRMHPTRMKTKTSHTFERAVKVATGE